jgi:hypothetical protein
MSNAWLTGVLQRCRVDNDNHPDPDQPSSPDAPDWEASIARYQQLAEKTQNPMYAWLALEARFHSQLGPLQDGPVGPEFSIPGWVAEYLLAVTQDLISLSSGLDPRITPELFDGDRVSSYAEVIQSADFRASIDIRRLCSKKAMELLPMALRLRRPGWNAFDSFEATTNKMQDFRAFEAMRAGGVPHKEALHAIGKGIGVTDPSRVQARIREGRDLAEGDEVVEPGG